MAVVTVVLSWVWLLVKNADVMYQFQWVQLFQSGPEAFRQCLEGPGGIFTYAGTWLQQFMYHPTKGVVILMVVYLVSYMASLSAFGLKGARAAVAAIPFAGFITSLTDTGYWIYVLKVPEYVFTPVLMYLAFTLLALVACRWKRVPRCVWQICCTVLYIWYSIRWMHKALVPEDIQGPFMLAFISSALLLPAGLVPGIRGKAGTVSGAVVTMAAAIFMVVYVASVSYRDVNYKREFRMARAAVQADWDGVLKWCGDGPVTRQMWLLRSAALLNEGRIGDELYKLNPKTVPPRATKGESVHMVETDGPLIYFLNARTHFAYRWCIENMVEYGPSAGRLRLMIMCSLIHGEWEVARKYIDILSGTRYHREWAQSQLRFIENPELLKQDPLYGPVLSMYSDITSITDGDEGLCERFLVISYSARDNVNDPMLSELCLNYAMQRMYEPYFWKQLACYMRLHPGKELPVHYQEAVYMFSTMNPDQVPADIDLESITISDDVRRRASQIRDDRSSYFWFYMFCSDNMTY